MSLDSLINKNYLQTEKLTCPVVERKEGMPLLRLNSNENQMGTSTEALGAMIKTAAQVNSWSDDCGSELKKKLADKYQLGEDNITIDSGLLPLIQHITDVFVNESDEIIYSELCPEEISVLFRQKTADCTEMPLLSGGEQDLNSIRDKITDKTKIVFLMNPYNPTGAIIKNAALEEFLLSLPENTVCVLDETYLDYADSAKYKSAVSLINECNLIVCHSFSAAYGLAGNESAYAAASKEIIEVLSKSVPYKSVSKLALAAATAAIDDTGFVHACVDEVTKSREYLKNELRSLRFKPYRTQANFMYVKLPENISIETLNAALVDKGIYVKTYADAFRITIGTGWQCEYVVNSIKEFLGLRK